MFLEISWVWSGVAVMGIFVLLVIAPYLDAYYESRLNRNKETSDKP